MKTLLAKVVLATSIVLATPVPAAPYCAALENLESLPKKYQKRGPFYSDAKTGWIIGADQLKADFAVSEEATELWRLIAAEFKARGAQLVVLAAPPRPLFVSEDTVTAMGLDGSFDRQALSQRFSDYIAALNQAGLVAPDLSVLAESDVSTSIYFKRDTHWTPRGAALSAAYLRSAMAGAAGHDVMPEVPFSADYSEKGSLSVVVEQVCGERPRPETVPAPVFAKRGTASDLLSQETGGPRIALVGTSFSDRYQRDAYQVADALAHVLDGTVENHAVTGGGLVGSMTAFISSGALDRGQFQTVVWESPYTAALTRVDGLRQILGALRGQSATHHTPVKIGPVGDAWTGISHAFDAVAYSGLEIETPGRSTGTLVVELIGQSGEKTRIKLIKSERIDPAQRSDRWQVALAALEMTDIARIKLRLVGQEATHGTELRLLH